MGKRKRMKHFKVTNYGVYDEVTGTSVMLEVDGLKILFDYGLYQSNLLDAKQIIEANWKAKKDIPLEEIDSVVIENPIELGKEINSAFYEEDKYYYYNRDTKEYAISDAG